MNRICTICARAGSKGLLGKNTRPLLGKPLIAHTLEQALSTDLFDCVAVSSDCDNILQIAEECGADEIVMRPTDMATSEAAKLPAIRHAVKISEDRRTTRFDTIVDLDATSPIRTGDDIHSAVMLLERSDAFNLITGVPARRSPYFNMVEKGVDGYAHLVKKPNKPIVRRQDTPKCYDMNASIYVWKRGSFFDDHVHPITSRTLLYEMEEHQAYDIDSETDFMIVEALMKHQKK